MKRKIGITDGILLLAALLCLVMALAGPDVWKMLGNRLASDGDLERLTEHVISVLRLAAGAGFVLFAGLEAWKLTGPESFRRFFSSLASLPGRCIRDAAPFFRDLVNALHPGKDLLMLLVILAAGTVLRIIRLSEPLLHDEAYSMAIWGRSDLLFAVSDYHLPNNHVFHSFLVNLIYHHLGKSPELLRLPVLISGCLLILAVWLLGKLLYDRRIALAAAGLTAFAPFLVFYSVNARGYELQALLSVLTLGLAVYGKRTRNIFAWFLLILLSGLNFFTLPIALYPFGGICVWLFLNVLIFDRKRCAFESRLQLFKYLIFMGVCVSVLSLMLYVPLVRYSGWDSFFGNIYIGGTEASTFRETMVSRLYDNVQAFTETLPLTVCVFIGIGLLLSPFAFRKNSPERVPYTAALLLWMLLLIPFQRPNLWPRTLLFMHPFLLLTAASGLFLLQHQPKLRTAVCLVSAVLILWSGISQFRVALQKGGKVGADEKAVQLIIGREGPNAGNIHFVTAAQDNAPLWIYADGYGIPGTVFDKRKSFNTVYAFVNPLNDAYLGPRDLDDLLERFGPGNNFIDTDSGEILMNEDNGILYRFNAREGAVRKSYGDFPAAEQ